MTIINQQSMNMAIKDLLDRDQDLAEVVRTHGPPTYWSRNPGFSTLVHIILEQQVSLASAQAVFMRLNKQLNPLTPGYFLTLDDTELRRMGFSRQKIAYCRELAKSILDMSLPIEELNQMTDDEIYQHLMAVKGIGKWTADIYLLIALNRPDVWPSSDLALIRALKQIKNIPAGLTPDLMEKYTDSWKPWRSVAARILWHYYLSNLNQNQIM